MYTIRRSSLTESSTVPFKALNNMTLITALNTWLDDNVLTYFYFCLSTILFGSIFIVTVYTLSMMHEIATRMDEKLSIICRQMRTYQNSMTAPLKTAPNTTTEAKEKNITGLAQYGAEDVTETSNKAIEASQPHPPVPNPPKKAKRYERNINRFMTLLITTNRLFFTIVLLIVVTIFLHTCMVMMEFIKESWQQGTVEKIDEATLAVICNSYGGQSSVVANKGTKPEVMAIP